MKALILNSGLGSRMGDLTREHPKAMTGIAPGETIVSRQLRLLSAAGVRKVVMTTGIFEAVLRDYCESLALPLDIEYVNNPISRKTNYIYSIHLARELLREDVLLMHGDLVFSEGVLRDVLAADTSVMAVSSTLPLPEKDFKAVLQGGSEGDISGRLITKVGIEFFENAVAAQPLYFLRKEGWLRWLEAIGAFCAAGNVKVYAENALNTLEGAAGVRALDVKDRLCAEIDTPEDLARVSALLRKE